MSQQCVMETNGETMVTIMPSSAVSSIYIVSHTGGGSHWRWDGGGSPQCAIGTSVETNVTSKPSSNKPSTAMRSSRFLKMLFRGFYTCTAFAHHLSPF